MISYCILLLLPCLWWIKGYQRGVGGLWAFCTGYIQVVNTVAWKD